MSGSPRYRVCLTSVYGCFDSARIFDHDAQKPSYFKKYHAPSKCWFCIRIVFCEVGKWAWQWSTFRNSMYGLVLDHRQKININWRSPTFPNSSKINKISRGPKISWFHHDRNYQLCGHVIINYGKAESCMMITFVFEWKFITQALAFMDFKKYHLIFLRDIFWFAIWQWRWCRAKI